MAAVTKIPAGLCFFAPAVVPVRIARGLIICGYSYFCCSRTPLRVVLHIYLGILVEVLWGFSCVFFRSFSQPFRTTERGQEDEANMKSTCFLEEEPAAIFLGT